MAHPCPVCGLTCHCGGDIDDCCFEGTRFELLCKHCDDDKEEEPHEDDRDELLDGSKPDDRRPV